MRTGQGLQRCLHSHLLDVGHRSPCALASVIREGQGQLKPQANKSRHTDLGDVLICQVLQVTRRGIPVHGQVSRIRGDLRSNA